MNKKRYMTSFDGARSVLERSQEYHSPTDDMDDTELGLYIENERLKYLRDWWQYIERDEKVFSYQPY